MRLMMKFYPCIMPNFSERSNLFSLVPLAKCFNLLLTEFEGHTVSFGPSFLSIDLCMAQARSVRTISYLGGD